MSQLPYQLAIKVQGAHEGLRELVGSINALKNSKAYRSPEWNELNSLHLRFCEVLAASNETMSTLGALQLLNQVEPPQACEAHQLPLHPLNHHHHQSARDPRMLAANDHTLDDD